MNNLEIMKNNFGIEINDNISSNETTWSSEKIKNEIKTTNTDSVNILLDEIENLKKEVKDIDSSFIKILNPLKNEIYRKDN